MNQLARISPPSRSLLTALICCHAIAAGSCASSPPGLPPPGFGTNPTLFYPIAVAVDPTGQNLYVANSNFDQNFTAGSIVQLPTAAFNPCTGSQTPSPSVCSNANQFGNIPFSGSLVQSQALLDSFAGQMFIDCPPLATAATRPACNNTQKRLYVTTRGADLLSTALLDATTGHLICPTDSSKHLNCSVNAIQLGNAPLNMSDPFAFTFGLFPLPGSSTPTGQLIVTHMAQGETNMNGVGEDAVVAIIPEPTEANPPAAPTTSPFSSVAYKVDLAQPNVSPASPAADAVAISPTGTIYVGGCFILTQGEVVVPCNVDANVSQYHEDPIRFFSAAANENAEVEQSNLGGEFSGGQIVAMLMSSDGQHLYVATSTPNALVTIELPEAGLSPLPVTRSVVTLANSPNQLLLLPRTGMRDLVAVTASDPNVVLANSNAFMVVDPTLGTVVAQLQPIGLQPPGMVGGVVGRTPYGMTALPTVTGTGASQQITSYRVFVALFTDCAVAAIDVPTLTPWDATRVSILGSCPNGI